MKVEEIIRLYTEEKYTLRMIADVYKSNHHKVKRILTKNNIEITNKGRKRKPFTDDHRNKISKATKGRKAPNVGKKMSISSRYKNMKSHLKYDVSLNFLEQFEIERLMCLNDMIKRKDRISKDFDTYMYIKYIQKFYNDFQFNKIFNIWILSGKDIWAKPSLDHINPISKGGSNNLDNLQVLSWFENRAKCDMNQTEWEKFKTQTNMKCDYFI